MQPTDVIKKPLITEKSTHEAGAVRNKGPRQGEPLNRYSFLVDMRANKHQIKAAVEAIYDVQVAAVRTQVRKGRTHRTRHGVTNTGDWKKAVVELAGEGRIELF